MMKLRICMFVIVILSVQAVAAAFTVDGPRIRFTLNDNWKFTAADPANAADTGFDDSAWTRVDLPHTWNIADTLDDEPGYRRAPSWYRREFTPDPVIAGRRIFLYFEGANQVTELFVNGGRVGRHIGGYSAFVFEVTERLRFAERNVFAVRVDNTRVLDIPPIDGDFNMHGGIYRDVWVVAVNDVHVRIDDLASPGVWIRTPRVSANEALVNVEGTIVNRGSVPRRVTVENAIIDPTGAVVLRERSSMNVTARGDSRFSQTGLRVARPKLWSPSSPDLYRLRTTVTESGRKIDEVFNPFGFRWFRFHPSEGFFLNGKPLKLYGTNRHQDHEGYGNAVPDHVQVRDLEIIKRTGFNFVRLAHYPQDPSVLEAADRLGLLIWEEIPIVNRIHVSPAFNGNAASQLREMIRQHRNHPSVIMWGFMNEVFLPVPQTEAHVRATVELARMLEGICKKEDPDRPTAIAFDHGARDLYNSSGLGEVTQIVGWNLYHGWYYQTFDDLGRFMDEQHRLFPDRVHILSEYGANADLRVHALQPKRFDSTVEWQRLFHEAYMRQIAERPFLAGSAVWNNFDFSSEFRGETIPHINQKGLFTYGRQPKDIAFFYKAALSAEPVLHIAVRDWAKRSGPSQQPVDVYTNLDNVELTVNGVSLGTKSGGHAGKISWNVGFRKGMNAIAARAARDRSTVTDIATVEWIDPADLSDISVNVGSNAEYVERSGRIWQADRAFKAGGWGYIGEGSKEVTNLRNIFGTDEDAVAQTAREGPVEYRFDVSDGSYEVELWFAELRNIRTGERVFDVFINQTRSVAGLDLSREVGPFRLLSRRFIVAAEKGSGISVRLSPVSGAPIISGLRSRRIN